MRHVALAALLAACNASTGTDGTAKDAPTESPTETTETTPPDTGGPIPTDTGAPPTSTGDVSALQLDPPATVENGRFSTSDVCATCHDNAPSATAMRDEDGREIAPYDLWQGSMMANAGRDPLWRAVMSAEVQATPAAADAIGNKCTTCHAPMASADAALQGDPLPTADVLTAGTERTDLALDGVSCTLCHQIETTGLGTDASFSGGYVVRGQGNIYGPHSGPFSMPMTMESGFTPIASAHTLDSSLCATCHTLTTDALAADGTPTGGHVVEQAPYLEWQLSDLSGTTSCQDCHLPKSSEDGVPLSTRIAHNPMGMDFPPTGPRSPYGRHVLVGGNTLVPAILRDFRSVLQPRGTDAALDATIAAARAQLAERTAEVSIVDATLADEVLAFTADIDVLSGHKLPTGIPLRRVWLHATVTDATGAVVFESGAVDGDGRLVDGAGQVLPAETVGGPIPGHLDQVTADDEVAVFEAVLADGAGDPTFLLLRAEGWVKDNRLLPEGFDVAAAGALEIAPVGTGSDPDFTGGGDAVHYSVDVAGAVAPLTVDLELLYQPLSARWADELFASGTPEALAFQVMWGAADRSPEPIDAATASVP